MKQPNLKLLLATSKHSGGHCAFLTDTCGFFFFSFLNPSVLYFEAYSIKESSCNKKKYAEEFTCLSFVSPVLNIFTIQVYNFENSRLTILSTLTLLKINFLRASQV